MNFFNVLLFLATTVMIEFMIEILRFISYGIIHNAWPKNVLLTHENQYLSWFLNCTETITVMTLLYLGYSVPVIVASVFLLIFVLKELGTLLISKLRSF